MERSVPVSDLPFDDLVVGEINKLLICLKCKKIYSNPVLNISCGHTFCKHCFDFVLDQKSGSKTAKCHLDSKCCDFKALIINRFFFSTD